VILAANQAFVHAMSITAVVAAVVAVGGALVALLFLPARPGEEETVPVDDLALTAQAA
jgi:hypothetical protein